jgi:hypothetical protein
MIKPFGGGRSNPREDVRALSLAEELGAQLGRLKGAGPKLRQFLSMGPARPARRRAAVAGGAACASRRRALGPVRPRASCHRAGSRRARRGAVHRRRRGAIRSRLARPGSPRAHKRRGARRGQGAAARRGGGRRGRSAQPRLVGPIIKRLAPGLDAGALLAELRERISDELDYEIEAQNQRRLERRFRGHPHVRLPRVYTDLSTRRVLVTEYIEGRHDTLPTSMAFRRGCGSCGRGMRGRGARLS